MDISAILLVGPQTSREEFKSLYYEMYKLQRLLGSPPGEPEWIKELIAEVVSSLKDCLVWKGGKPPQMMEEPDPVNIWPPRSKIPRRGNRDTSTERRLAKVREAHQRALAIAATLEEEIERLSWPITRGQSEAHAHSRSQDCLRWRSRGWKSRCHQAWLEESHAPYFEYHPPWRGPEFKEKEEAPHGFQPRSSTRVRDQRLTASSRDWLKAWRRRIGGCPSQNPQWRSWRVG